MGTEQELSAGESLIQALDKIEKEKGVDKEIIFKAIEDSLLAACKNEYGKSDNISVVMNRENGEIKVYSNKKILLIKEHRTLHHPVFFIYR